MTTSSPTTTTTTTTTTATTAVVSTSEQNTLNGRVSHSTNTDGPVGHNYWMFINIFNPFFTFIQYSVLKL